MTKTKTAAETYAERQQDIAAMLDWLKTELEGHAELAKEGPSDWSLAGDLGYIRQQIKQTLAALAPFEESEIEEALAELRM